MDGSSAGKTSQFRHQHTEILDVIRDIDFYVRETSLMNDIPEIVMLLMRLSGKLKAHLSMEESSLYPDMLNSSNEEAAEAAKAYQAEMVGLAKAFQDYMTAWRAPDAIVSDPDGFKAVSTAVFKALTDRFQRENNELYRLADGL